MGAVEWLMHWYTALPTLGAVIAAARAGYSFWRRRPGKPIPVLGWLGHLLVNELLLGEMTLRFLTEQAKVQRLKETIARLQTLVADQEESSRWEQSDDSLSAYPGSILIRSKRPIAEPPSNSPTKPDAIPPTSTPTSETP